ncbi:MAG TPA: SgcJ/EcaC family oxidoreductase [Thermoanaerobaculia bacterium]|nr:SgcJ/EcaC family oxidoreductase [Thermoanaerobaculia bacterium]
MRIPALTLLISLSLMVPGCQQAEVPAEPAASEQLATPDPAASRQDIERLRDEWLAAAERDDAAAVAALYTDDAVVASPDNPPAEGRQAIEALWTRNFPMASGLEVRSSRIEASGDLAYDYGEFSQRITPPKGKPMDVTGRYLVVLQRQPDGAWKITRHVSFNMPPETRKG